MSNTTSDTPRTDAEQEATHNGTCLPTCDSFAHDEFCPYCNPDQVAFRFARALERELREETAKREAAEAKLQEFESRERGPRPESTDEFAHQSVVNDDSLSIRNELVTARSDLANKNACLSEVLAQRDSLRAEVERLKATIDAWESVNLPGEVPMAYIDVCQRLADSEKARELAEARYEVLKSERDKWAEQAGTANMQLAAEQKARREAEAKIKEMDEGVDAHEEELERLHGIIANQQSALTAAEERARKAEGGRDDWKRDAEAYKSQLRLSEEHAMAMAKDFDASIAVVQFERDTLQERVKALEAALTESKLQLAQVEHKFERAGGIWKVADKGVELGSMSWASNVENALRNLRAAIDSALTSTTPKT